MERINRFQRIPCLLYTSGLSPEQVDRLKEEFAIYAVRSGRINVAGITEDNIRYLCESIVKVL